MILRVKVKDVFVYGYSKTFTANSFISTYVAITNSKHYKQVKYELTYEKGTNTSTKFQEKIIHLFLYFLHE